MKENAMPVTIKETDYQKLVAPYKEDAFQALKELVSIPSVLDEDTESDYQISFSFTQMFLPKNY